MTGAALPLIVRAFGLSAPEKGAVGAAPLFGIAAAATALAGALVIRLFRIKSRGAGLERV